MSETTSVVVFKQHPGQRLTRVQFRDGLAVLQRDSGTRIEEFACDLFHVGLMACAHGYRLVKAGPAEIVDPRPRAVNGGPVIRTPWPRHCVGCARGMGVMSAHEYEAYGRLCDECGGRQ